MWLPQRSLLLPGLFFLVRNFSVRLDYALCILINSAIPEASEHPRFNTLIPIVWTELVRVFCTFVLGHATRIPFPKLFTPTHPLFLTYGIRRFATPIEVISFLIYHTEIVLPLDAIAERVGRGVSPNVYSIRRSYMRKFCACVSCNRTRSRLYRQFFSTATPLHQRLNTAVQTEPASDQNRCIVCLENERSISLIHGATCHSIVCEVCVRTLILANDRFPCPLCRQPVERIAKFYLA
jgi:hypothetical protein